jgi:hypothetical protein
MSIYPQQQAYNQPSFPHAYPVAAVPRPPRPQTQNRVPNRWGSKDGRGRERSKVVNSGLPTPTPLLLTNAWGVHATSSRDPRPDMPSYANTGGACNSAHPRPPTPPSTQTRGVHATASMHDPPPPMPLCTQTREGVSTAPGHPDTPSHVYILCTLSYSSSIPCLCSV